MIVENRPGAGGNIAADIVAKSPADGYTLVLGVTGSHSINPATRKDLPYHPLKDFEPITQVAQFANAIAAHPSFPANSLQELIALAKRDPGKLLYGTDGVGTASHLTMALLASKAGIKLGAVPYKGATPMLTELLGGQVQLGITGLPAMQTHAKAGKLKLLAVTTPQRVASNPDVPTIAEQGFPGFAAAPWSGFLAPRGTPRAIIDKLSTDLAKVMHLPDVQEKMASQGISVVTNRPEEFRAFLENQLQQWAEAARLAGLEPQ
jgi:tripartite-type tricarboxylate transporter receptor subunit TctC